MINLLKIIEVINIQEKKPIVVVSSCLEFEYVRYNGQIIKSKTVEKLKEFVEFIPVCPEVEIGLGVPRKPIRIIKNPKTKEKKLVQPLTGEDVTKKMSSFADKFLKNLKDVDGFILKEESPTSGLYSVKQYLGDSKSAAVVTGSGFFGEEILKRFSQNCAIESEKRLNNQNLRELFFLKIFLFRDFKEVIKTRKIKELQDFHARKKFLFLIYNQKNFREMGRIIANYKNNFKEVVDAYSPLLFSSFKKQPTENQFISGLEHIFGYFKEKLTKDEKNHFLELIEEYRDLRIPLSVVLNLLKSYAIRYKDEYILNQTILQPFPKKLIFK